MKFISTKSWDYFVRTIFIFIETNLGTIKLILNCISHCILTSIRGCIEATVCRLIKLIEIIDRNLVRHISGCQRKAILVKTGVLWNGFTTHLCVIDLVRSFFNLFINCSQSYFIFSIFVMSTCGVK